MAVNKNAIMLRDSEGRLLPATQHSELFGGEVKLKRITDGDINEIREKSANMSNDELIEKFLIEPQLTKDEIKQLPTVSKKELVILTLMTTGMERKDVENLLNRAINETNEKKN